MALSSLLLILSLHLLGYFIIRHIDLLEVDFSQERHKCVVFLQILHSSLAAFMYQHFLSVDRLIIAANFVFRQLLFRIKDSSNDAVSGE